MRKSYGYYNNMGITDAQIETYQTIINHIKQGIFSHKEIRFLDNENALKFIISEREYDVFVAIIRVYSYEEQGMIRRRYLVDPFSRNIESFIRNAYSTYTEAVDAARESGIKADPEDIIDSSIIISKEDKKRLLDAMYSSYPKKDVDMNVIGDVIARQINGWSYPIKSDRDVIRYSEISNLYPSLELFHKNIMTTYNDTAGCYDDMGYNGPTHTEIRIDYNSLDEENKIYADLLVKKGIAKVIDEGSGKKGISIFVPCRRDEYVREVSNRMFGVLVGFKKQDMIYGRISNQEVLNYLNGYLRYFDSEVKANINEILSTGINGANLERVNRLLQLGFYYDKGEDQFWLDEYYYRRHMEFVNSQRVIDTNAKLEKKIPQE